MPRFSIILPCFNASETLADTLASLRSQSVTDWEALCVDDGSSDDTRSIIARYATRDPRIHLLTNPTKGPSAARNHAALTKARADILCFCDADDIWEPEKLAQLSIAFDTPLVTATYGQIGFFNARPGDGPTRSTVKQYPLIIQDLLAENPVCTLSNLSLRKDAFAAISGFDETLVHNEDLDLLVRLIGHGAAIHGIDQLQVWYRTTPSGLSANLSAMAEARKTVVRRAAQFGIAPSRRSEAIYLRYLARRALRLSHARALALSLTAKGLCQSPIGFLYPLRRGGGTALGAFLALILPTRLRLALFS